MIVLVFIMLAGLVYAGGSWDSFSGGGRLNSSGASGENVNHPVSKINNSVPSSLGKKVEKGGLNPPSASLNGASVKYTENFYMALGIGGFGLLILIFLLYLLLRPPKNKWRSKKSPRKKG